MRKWWVAVAAAGMMALGAPASASSTVTLTAEIHKGNGAVAWAEADPVASGVWSYSAQVSGTVNEVYVQLYLVGSRGECTGAEVGSHRLSGTTDNTSWRKTSVPPRTYTGTFDSTSDALHCARVIIHGQPGAKAVVDYVSPTEPSSGDLLDLL